MAGYIDKWQAVADDIIAVLLVKPEAWEDAIDSGVAVDDMPPGPWQEVYRVIVTLRGENMRETEPPVILHDTLVASRCTSAVTVEWVAERTGLWDELRESAFDKSCLALKKYSTGHRQLETLRIGQARMKAVLEGNGDPNEVTTAVVEDLRTEQVPSVTQMVDIADLAEDERRKSDLPPVNVHHTGIALLDEWLRGLTPGEFLAWVAAYKMRKTSVLANVIINFARNKKRVILFSYDESRSRFTNRVEAVLMAEHMWNSGNWNLRSDDGTPLNVVDGKMIRNAGERWRKWPRPLVLAREYAFDEMAKMRGNFVIYDRPCGLTTVASMKSICTYEAMKGGEFTLCGVDHLQRILGKGDSFKTAEYGSQDLHELAGATGMIMWLLSQINETAVKNDSDEYSPNAKGGGGLASNADTVLQSRYKVGDCLDPKLLRFDLKLAREGEAPAHGYVEIHPASGWITPRRVDSKNMNTL